MLVELEPDSVVLSQRGVEALPENPEASQTALKCVGRLVDFALVHGEVFPD